MHCSAGSRAYGSTSGRLASKKRGYCALHPGDRQNDESQASPSNAVGHDDWEGKTTGIGYFDRANDPAPIIFSGIHFLFGLSSSTFFLLTTLQTTSFAHSSCFDPKSSKVCRFTLEIRCKSRKCSWPS